MSKTKRIITILAVLGIVMIVVSSCITNQYDSDVARHRSYARIAEAESRSVSALARANSMMTVSVVFAVVALVSFLIYVFWKFIQGQQNQNIEIQQRLFELKMLEMNNNHQLEMTKTNVKLKTRSYQQLPERAYSRTIDH